MDSISVRNGKLKMPTRPGWFLLPASWHDTIYSSYKNYTTYFASIQDLFLIFIQIFFRSRSPADTFHTLYALLSLEPIRVPAPCVYPFTASIAAPSRLVPSHLDIPFGSLSFGKVFTNFRKRIRNIMIIKIAVFAW